MSKLFKKNSKKENDELKDRIIKLEMMEAHERKKVKQQLNRVKFAEDYFAVGEVDYLAHIGLFFKGGNAGDTYIRRMVKEVLKNESSSIIEKNCREIFGKLEQSILNKSKAVVVGAGGLIWTKPESKSGWQWNVTNKFISQMERPIILYSIGVTNFGAKNPIDTKTRDNLRLIFDKKDSFILPRNQKSLDILIEQVGKPKGYAGIQPCPSTVVRHMMNVKLVKSKTIAFNIPMDKLEERYGDKMEVYFTAIAKAMKELERDGYTCKVYEHIPLDAEFHQWLKNHGYSFKLESLTSKNFEEIKTTYENTLCSFGGRGHSVMIPFGLGVPVVGFVANPKVRYFHEEAEKIFPAIELDSINKESIVEKITNIINDKNWEKKNKLVTKKFYDQTNANLEQIRRVINQ